MSKILTLTTPSAISRHFEISPWAAAKWFRPDGTGVPADRVLELAKFTGVTPHEIRPDLYPHPLDGIREEA
jgi:hypothetical protein